MRAWLQVMVVEIDAEFPSWEFVQAYSPFSLSTAPAAAAHRQGPDLRRHLCRLAHALGLDEPSLHWEYVSHLDAATSLYAGTDVTHKEAWSMACAQSSDLKSNLETVISAWLATVCSSSGVEHNFSKGAWGYSCRQLKASVQHERSTHRVLLYDGPFDILIRGAQKCWRRCFGIVRASGSSNRKARADKGTHKRKSRSTRVS